ncbi:unnamed protein product [Coregonus sp. 'balchen']|nr:unnamed protein product [Coregonus sp. 'balchen']
MSLAAEAFVSQIAAAEPWPENATLYQPLREDQILLSDCASSLAVQAYLRMCNLPVLVSCRSNAEYMSPSGKVPFVHVGNQVVSELGPIVQFTKAKRAEMKAYMELVNNMLLTAELYIQWCDDTTATEAEIQQPILLAPQPNPGLSEAVGGPSFMKMLAQCCQALSQRLGTQPYFFNKQPTELDALVFGHLFTILTTRLTSDELGEKIKSYSNLLAFCRRIEQSYFEDSQAGSSSRGYSKGPSLF